ncbi:MAG: replication restart helicase PriA, partial [Chloroflexia bacterium]
RGLARKGLLRIEKRPARVRLTVLPEVARERAAALRRTLADERGLALLEALLESRALPLGQIGRIVPGAAHSDVQALVAAGVCRLEERELYRDPFAGAVPLPEPPPVLTVQQGIVWREIYEALGKGGYQVFLLHGVAGSGKTELYLRALGRVLREGRQAIVLVPEIVLTTQFAHRFAARFPGRIAVQHSGLSVGERYDQWRRIRDGKVDVVIGARSAVFSPLERLGLIVVDEEHDPSYKQEDPAPRYHAREVALALARLTGSMVILGSATPSCESYRRAEARVFRLLELPERIRVREGPAGVRVAFPDPSLPRVQVVDMREELRAGNRSMFSRDLQRALREVLERGEQAVLLLNRRGAATFVMCRACGYVVRCPGCEVPLVYHADRNALLCHRCGRTVQPPRTCPACHSPAIRYFGAGTERVAAEVQAFFPEARVLRWDQDTARDLETHREILEAFASGRVDVLVGTQVAAKGLNLPRVTLVGVVSADTLLGLPDLRAAERTFQLLSQVVGEAGRAAERALVIVQTYHPEHYAVQAAARQDYRAFVRQEMAYRQRNGYPPFRQLALLTYVHPDEGMCREETVRLAAHLRRRVEATQGATLIGPAPAFVPRFRGRYRWQLLLLAPRVHPLLLGMVLGSGWTVNVDPLDILT